MFNLNSTPSEDSNPNPESLSSCLFRRATSKLLGAGFAAMSYGTDARRAAAPGSEHAPHAEAVRPIWRTVALLVLGCAALAAAAVVRSGGVKVDVATMLRSKAVSAHSSETAATVTAVDESLTIIVTNERARGAERVACYIERKQSRGNAPNSASIGRSVGGPAASKRRPLQKTHERKRVEMLEE